MKFRISALSFNHIIGLAVSNVHNLPVAINDYGRCALDDPHHFSQSKLMVNLPFRDLLTPGRGDAGFLHIVLPLQGCLPTRAGPECFSF